MKYQLVEVKQIPLISSQPASSQSEPSITDWCSVQPSQDLSFVNIYLLNFVLCQDDKKNPVLPECTKIPNSEDNVSKVKSI